jgi:hypothetical protein
MFVEAALVVERSWPPLEQRTATGDARWGLGQELARNAIVPIAMRADDLNHAFEHLASGSGPLPSMDTPPSRPAGY